MLAARERFLRALGAWAVNGDVRVPGSLPDVPAEELPLSDLEALAIAQRLDVAAARSELDAATMALALARQTRYVPGASVGASYERNTIEGQTINSRVWRGAAPLVVKKGDRVRVRIGNVSMDSHPIHLHGYHFEVTATDGGTIPKSAGRRPRSTSRRARRGRSSSSPTPKGDWAFHCHKSHHTMNAMSHDLPLMIGVKQGDTEQKVRKLLPGYMATGSNGMGNMMDMGRPKNTLPMMSGEGPYWRILADADARLTQREIRDPAKNRASTVGDALAALVTDGRVTRTGTRYVVSRP